LPLCVRTKSSHFYYNWKAAPSLISANRTGNMLTVNLPTEKRISGSATGSSLITSDYVAVESACGSHAHTTYGRVIGSAPNDELEEHLESGFETSPCRKYRCSLCEKKHRKVRFSSVRVHSHRCVLGSNPAVSCGLPLELDWDYNLSENYDIDDYEDEWHAQPQKLTRLTSEEREDRLRKNGYENSSFMRVLEELIKIKASREIVIEEKKQQDTRDRHLNDYFIMANVSLRDFRRENRLHGKPSQDERPPEQGKPSEKTEPASPSRRSIKRTLSPKLFSRGKVLRKVFSPNSITAANCSPNALPVILRRLPSPRSLT